MCERLKVWICKCARPSMSDEAFECMSDEALECVSVWIMEPVNVDV